MTVEEKAEINLTVKSTFYYIKTFAMAPVSNEDVFNTAAKGGDLVAVGGGALGGSRKSNKKALRFSVMVAGQAGIGKSTFLATLFDPYLSTNSIPQEKMEDSNDECEQIVFAKTEQICTFVFEVESEPGLRLQVEAIDTPGYDDNLSPDQL